MGKPIVEVVVVVVVVVVVAVVVVVEVIVVPFIYELTVKMGSGRMREDVPKEYFYYWVSLSWK